MKTAVVICPGRGTYNAGELGYLGRHFPAPDLLARFDGFREAAGQPTLSALDRAERFSMATHTRGDNASGLIFAASYGDFLALNRSKIEVVAVTGNSMGWYTALACGGALEPDNAFAVANTMGTLMHAALIGGQTIYPWLDEDWVPRPERKRELLELAGRIGSEEGKQLYLSIDLGGMLVLAGNKAGLEAFESAVEPLQGRFPMRLGNHAAFHTPLQEPVARQGRDLLGADLFTQPSLPMIDGRGKIWNSGSTDRAALHAYTLGEQVTCAYDFTHAISVAAREFAPDLFIVLGPGTTLGGAVGQALILNHWQGLKGRDDFRTRQASDPLLVSMGMPEQRMLVE